MRVLKNKNGRLAYSGLRTTEGGTESCMSSIVFTLRKECAQGRSAGATSDRYVPESRLLRCRDRVRGGSRRRLQYPIPLRSFRL